MPIGGWQLAMSGFSRDPAGTLAIDLLQTFKYVGIELIECPVSLSVSGADT